MTARHDRIRNLGAAALLAVAATLITIVALPHDSKPAQAARVKTAKALVATRDLTVGTSVSAALADHAVALRTVPQTALAPDAVTQLPAVSGEVVIQPVYAGEQVTQRRLGTTGAAGLRSVLRGNERIIQISGTPTQLLAGTVRAGDHVDVVASVKVGPSQTPYAAVVLHDLVVLQAPSGAGSSSVTSGTPTATATVRLSDVQTQRLFYVLQNGSWSFVLRPASRASATHVGPVSAASVLTGGE